MRESEIIGHSEVRQYFSAAIRQGTLSHAHLIIGEDGIGKSVLAREFAVKILGREEIKQYVDIIDFQVAKGKKSIGVDEIRNIIEEVSKRPYEGDRKVIIVHSGDKITVQAQNAFLKTIEEPPRGIFIFILAENSETILDTIKSRCQIHRLNRLQGQEMERFIDRRYPGLRKSEREVLTAFAGGIPGRGEYFMENDDFKSIRETSVKLLADINRSRESEFLNYSNFLLKYKDNWEEVLDLILSFIRDILIFKDTGSSSLIMNKDKLRFIEECSGQFSYKQLEMMIDSINTAKDSLRSNVNPGLTFDVMLINMQNS
ncbi:MAG: DNA polymerase III subunit delta' [Bacillota bacterium]|nr:DNA polymerase III subunit delta' [Bacillota bacterium]